MSILDGDQEKVYRSIKVAEILEVSRRHLLILRKRAGVTPEIRIEPPRNTTANFYSLEDMAKLRACIRFRPKKRHVE